MALGIEFDTENSIRKYQVCKPVAPQKILSRSNSIEDFSYYAQHVHVTVYLVFVCMKMK